MEQLLSWPSYRAAWEASEVPREEWPGLWRLLIREERTDVDDEPQEIEWGLVSTEPFEDGRAGFQQWRVRWDVENKGLLRG